eukprot:1191331-Prorocentrum_minimum.AAC.2
MPGGVPAFPRPVLVGFLRRLTVSEAAPSCVSEASSSPCGLLGYLLLLRVASPPPAQPGSRTSRKASCAVVDQEVRRLIPIDDQ